MISGPDSGILRLSGPFFTSPSSGMFARPFILSGRHAAHFNCNPYLYALLIDRKKISMIGKLLGFDKHTHSLRTEIIAGATTFLAMCYILVVNPAILGEAGMEKGAVFTATALASGLATLLLALLARLPIALAPSMALNAFFAFTLVEGMGYSWQTAMTAMFVEGILFILITLLNIQELILGSIPTSLRYAISAGIGMFIAFVGLKNAGIIEANPSTFVTLGVFTPASVLAFAGILLSGALTVWKVKGALFYSIVGCTLLGIPLGVTTLPAEFSPVALPPSLAPTFAQFDFSELLTPEMGVVLFTLLFMNIFDTIGTLVGLTSKTGIMQPDGRVPRVKEVMLAASIGTTAGTLMGSSTISPFVESAAGIAEGGKTGLTAFTTGLLFVAALFFSPLFLIIPGAATTGALVMVGVLMMDAIGKIDLKDISEALPAFLTLLLTLLTYSIANGMIFGVLSYVCLKAATGRWKEVSPTMYILAGLFILNYAWAALG